MVRMTSRGIEAAVRVILVILGIGTATPALALGWASTVAAGYGIPAPADPMLMALLQHRGMLQAALGAALVWAAFQPLARVPAAVTAIVTKATFVSLLATLPGPSRLGQVPGVPFDLVAIALLAAVALRQVAVTRDR